MALFRRYAGQIVFVVALVAAMTPVWRWAALPTSPTFDEISQLICTVPRGEAERSDPPTFGENPTERKQR